MCHTASFGDNPEKASRYPAAESSEYIRGAHALNKALVAALMAERYQDMQEHTWSKRMSSSRSGPCGKFIITRITNFKLKTPEA